MIDTNDIIAVWGEHATNQQSEMIALVGAAILSKLGERSISISTHDLSSLHADYEVTTFIHPTDGWTVKLTQRRSGEPELPLESEK